MDGKKTGLPSLAARIRAWFRRARRDDRAASESNLRLDERRRERLRIARDLHDTFLQGLLSSSMQLHAAHDQLPEDSPAKPTVRRVLEMMAKGLDEGRAALHGLRSAEMASVSLEQALSDFGDDFSSAGRSRFRITVLGRPKPLDPALQEQTYLIAREALLNALRHSDAARIEVELEYLPARLRVVVRDDGSGFHPQTLPPDHGSHWGLLGMRERAAAIRAQLRVWSKPGAGTEIELSVPLDQ
jgi:signal transduction histidine kinase